MRGRVGAQTAKKNQKPEHRSRQDGGNTVHTRELTTCRLQYTKKFDAWETSRLFQEDSTGEGLYPACPFTSFHILPSCESGRAQRPLRLIWYPIKRYFGTSCGLTRHNSRRRIGVIGGAHSPLHDRPFASALFVLRPVIRILAVGQSGTAGCSGPPDGRAGDRLNNRRNR